VRPPRLFEDGALAGVFLVRVRSVGDRGAAGPEPSRITVTNPS